MSNKKQSLSYHSHFYEKRGLRIFVRRPLTLDSLFSCTRRIVVCRTSLHNTVDGPLALLVDIVAIRRSLVCLHPAVIAEAVALLKTVMVAVNPSPLDLAGLAAVPITEIVLRRIPPSLRCKSRISDPADVCKCIRCHHHGNHRRRCKHSQCLFHLIFLLLYFPGTSVSFLLKTFIF